MKLLGKVAIVTGGARGIGAAIARRYAAEGARLVIADIDTAAAEENLARIHAQDGEALFVQTDVSAVDQVESLFEAVMDTYGRVDILVNNAAIAHGPGATRHFLDMPAEMWQRLMDVHLNGLFYCSQRAARIMARQGGGCIINLSSCGASRAHRQMVAYDTTKGGIEAATRALALDLAPWSIRVNALAPGAIYVEQRSSVGRESVMSPGEIIPLARLGTPEDIAGAALFLASEDATYVTGQTLIVDGGLVAQLRTPNVDNQLDPALLRQFPPRAGD